MQSQRGDPVLKPPLFSDFKKFMGWKNSQDIHINNCNRRHQIKTEMAVLRNIGSPPPERISEDLREHWVFDKCNWAK